MSANHPQATVRSRPVAGIRSVCSGVQAVCGAEYAVATARCNVVGDMGIVADTSGATAMLLYILPVAQAPWLYIQLAVTVAWIALLALDVRKHGRKGLRVLLLAPLVVVAWWLAMVGDVLDHCVAAGC